MKDKQLIIDNLKLLYRAVNLQPESNFDLHRFKQETPCGTLFCTAGLAASMPEFQAQGMSIEVDGYNWWNVSINGIDLWQEGLDEEYDDVYHSPNADKLFGENCANNCFAERWEGDRDEQLIDDNCTNASMTDKQLALWRLEKQIEAVESQP